MRVPFVVGRLTTRTTEIVMLNQPYRRSPVPGPWRLRALVRPLPTLGTAEA